MIGATYLIGGLGFFLFGTIVGSFVNVCVYRIPFQKSLIWPGSTCPNCLLPVEARDNLPVVGWLLLRGACRRCGLPISPRYPLVELLVGLLFAALYATDVVFAPSGMLDARDLVRLFYHLILASFLVVATFIDYDLYIIPDEVTVSGMVLGLLLGSLIPGIRPEPSTATTMLGGLGVGVLGWAVGGGMVWSVRILGGLVFRREAMGFGDVTLLAMIGAFLGWQAAVLTFFLAPFLGLAHAFWKFVRLLVKFLTGLKILGSDRELPYGPYLSMAALALILAWPWLWAGWGGTFFANLTEVGLFLLGLES